MLTSQVPHDLIDSQKMSLLDLKALVDEACAFERAAKAGAPQMLLRGRKFGLFTAALAAPGSGGAGADEIALFDHAATELGAQVAHVQPQLSEASPPRQIENTAHMLGRLYDVVICQGMAPALVAQVRAFAGIPVLDRIPFSELPPSAMADGPCAASALDARRFLIQAWLVRTLI